MDTRTIELDDNLYVEYRIVPHEPAVGYIGGVEVNGIYFQVNREKHYLKIDLFDFDWITELCENEYYGENERW